METKIFVGNVPYQCTREDFQKCFRPMNGYVTADIIRRYKSKISRGFGFVIFKTKEQAEAAMKKTITLEDRTLRLSEYTPTNKSESTYTKKHQTDPKLAYQEGFMAGHMAGFQEGYKAALNSALAARGELTFAIKG
jgi:RNA recognition motif-containing protein